MAKNWADLRRVSRFLFLTPVLFLYGCFPPIFVPNIEHRTEFNAYAFTEAPELPWLSLDNGLDLYGWHDCYRFVLVMEKRTKHARNCADFKLKALPIGQKPDWKGILRYYGSAHGTAPIKIGSYLERPVSAYRDTGYRLLGITDVYGISIVLIRSKAQTDVTKPGDVPDDYAKVRRVSIDRLGLWDAPSRAKAACVGGSAPPTVRLVVFDEQREWIFAENDPPCDLPPEEKFIPSKLVEIHNVDMTSASTLEKPMQLFFLDHDPLELAKADFGQPRRVTRDSQLAAKGQRIYLAFAEMPLPKGKFTIDANTLRREVSVPEYPTQLCRYSRTEFLIGYMDQPTKRIELRECRPFPSPQADIWVKEIGQHESSRSF